MPESVAHYVGQWCVGELPAKDRQTTTVMRAGVHVLLYYLVANQRVSTTLYRIGTKNKKIGSYEEVERDPNYKYTEMTDDTSLTVVWQPKLRI